MSASKQKGYRLEKWLADYLTSNDIPAQRVLLSGAVKDGIHDSDVVIGTPEHQEAKIECKNRESLSNQMWDWLEGNDFLVTKKNKKTPLVTMSLDKFIQLWKKHD